MSHAKKAARGQAVAQRRASRRYRLMALISAPLAVAAVVALLIFTAPPAYSGFDVIGKQPAIVQVFLPG